MLAVLTRGACCDFEFPRTKWIKVIIGAHQLQGGDVLSMLAEPFNGFGYIGNGAMIWVRVTCGTALRHLT